MSRSRGLLLFGGLSAAERARKYGLVSAWNFNGSAGAQGTDSYGTNNLTDNNTVGAGTAKIGAAAGSFNGSTQRLTLADNTSLSMGDINCLFAGWFRFTGFAADQTILGKWNGTGSQREYRVFCRSATARLSFQVSKDGLSGGSVTQVDATTFGALSINTYYFFLAYHDAVNDEIGISVNGGAFDTAAWANGIFDGTAAFEIGSDFGGADFWPGLLDAIAIFKSPPAGVANVKTEIRNFLYNNGVGREYPW